MTNGSTSVQSPLKILTLVFPSNYPSFSADSIYTFNRILFTYLHRMWPSVKIFAAGPADMPQMHEEIIHIPLDLGINKFQVRFGFPWAQIRNILGEVQPNVCFVNMPEQAATLSVLIKDDLGLQCKVVNYVHYVPAWVDSGTNKITYERAMNEHGHGELVVRRILEGVQASDLTLICSKFGVRLLNNLATNLFGEVEILPHLSILPPPIDFDEIDSIGTVTRSSEPCFIYNHRLYDEYGTNEIFKILSGIAAQRQGVFKVLVTNPTEGRGNERSRLNPKLSTNIASLRELPFVRLEHFQDRRSYYMALMRSWGGLAPLKPHALWSMSVIDVLACRVPVLAFDVGCFDEMNIKKPFLVHTEAEYIKAFDELLRGNNLYHNHDEYRQLAEQFSGNIIARSFMEFL